MTTTSVQRAVALDVVGGWPRGDQFYTRLTERNRGLISDDDQQQLRSTPILVAGCGSIGGAVVEPLVRLGAEHLVLAEPDVYELHNLNRQQALFGDLGRNKAHVLAERMRQINPYGEVCVDERGVTADNVEAHVRAVGLIFDGVDVTAARALGDKYALHAAARRAGVPVVSGYDIAGTQLVLVYDYRDPSVRVLGGRLTGAAADDLQPLRFLARVIPLRAVPLEMFAELRRRLVGGDEPFPQLVYSAQLFGVLACRVGMDLLAGRPVRSAIVVDVPTLVRPALQRWDVRWRRLVELMRLSRNSRAYRR